MGIVHQIGGANSHHIRQILGEMCMPISRQSHWKRANQVSAVISPAKDTCDQ